MDQPSQKIRLPRKVPQRQRDKWYNENRRAGADDLVAFKLPILARASRATRRECLALFYEQHSFVFIFQCGGFEIDRAALAALAAAVHHIDTFWRRLRPRSFEIRFSNPTEMHRSTFQGLAKCFARMHVLGVTPTMTMDQRIISPTAIAQSVRTTTPIRTTTHYLFTLGIKLTQKLCSCGTHGRLGRRPRMLDCDREAEIELRRFMFCRQHARGYFFQHDVLKFLRTIGFEVSRVWFSHGIDSPFCCN